MGCLKLSYNHNYPLKVIHSKTYKDYYPFGEPLPGRNSVSSPQYEHGYQGQFTTKDEETGLDAFELRMWDSRLARWTSTDPYGQYHSPYLGMGNNPVSQIDPDGGLSALATKTITGAMIGMTAGGVTAGLAGGSNKDIGLAMLGGAVAGAAVGYGVGGGFSGINLPSLSIPSITPRQIAGLTANGFFSGLDGYLSAMNQIKNNPHVDIGEITTECLDCLPNTVTPTLKPQGNPVADAIYQGQKDFVSHPITQTAIEIATLPFGGGFKLTGRVAGGIIKSFTKHGINQVIQRGFRAVDILKIVREGKAIHGMGRHGPQIRYSLGGNTVVVNAKGKVVTAFSNAADEMFIPFK